MIENEIPREEEPEVPDESPEDLPLTEETSDERPEVPPPPDKDTSEPTQLPHLDEEAFRRRMDAAVRLCSSSMYHQARQKNAFRGVQAELFLYSLIDALVGLLSAAESKQTFVYARSKTAFCRKFSKT